MRITVNCFLEPIPYEASVPSSLKLQNWNICSMSPEAVHNLFSEIRMGDHVRLKSDEDRGAEWTVVGRSFGSMTFDISSGEANNPGRILHGVRSELLQRIATVPDQDT